MNRPPVLAALGRSAFHDDTRKLLEDHVTWTRLAIVAFADGSKGLTARLHDHITIAVELLQAATSGVTQASEAARARWYTNSDQVADHLSSLNPTAWPQPVVRSMRRTFR